VAQETAEAHGRVSLRPWRVGLIVDKTCTKDVRAAIAKLSAFCGGRYMPIIDAGTPVDDLQRLGRQFDIDSLHGEVDDGPVAELLAKPGWGWRGRGSLGPFGEQGHFRKGLLPLHALINESTDLFHRRCCVGASRSCWDQDREEFAAGQRSKASSSNATRVRSCAGSSALIS
jgi:hypothetical protein